MNFLEVARLALTADQMLSKSSHSLFDHDSVDGVKKGLASLAEFCQQQNDAQLKAAQEAELKAAQEAELKAETEIKEQP